MLQSRTKIRLCKTLNCFKAARKIALNFQKLYKKYKSPSISPFPQKTHLATLKKKKKSLQ